MAAHARKQAKQSRQGKPGRLSQLRQAYTITKQADPAIGWILLGTFLFASAVGIALFTLIPPAWLVLDVLTGVLLGVLATLIVFGRRATRSQLRQMEGKPGAAVAVLGSLKRGWRTDQAVAFTKQQDLVHRVVGPPGVVLVGEGHPARLKPLLTAEGKRHQRVAMDVPVHEVVVGDGPGEVPLSKLVRHVSKMGRQVQPAEMTDLLSRLKAVDARRPVVPIPKGPMPNSMKGMRGNLRGR